jgi:hypothetical protein
MLSFASTLMRLGERTSEQRSTGKALTSRLRPSSADPLVDCDSSMRSRAAWLDSRHQGAQNP